MNELAHSLFQEKVDMRILAAIEASVNFDDLDDLFEVYLSNILHMAPVHKAEIQLFSPQNELVTIASANWVHSDGHRKQKVRSESWVLDYRVKYGVRRIRVPLMRPAFSIPLLGPDGILGFLNIHLDKLQITDPALLNHFYLAGFHIAAKIREIRLNDRIEELQNELQNMVSNNMELQHRVTSLSKELYAVSAISTKINQSLDFDKSLRKSMLTTLKVFQACSILVYTKTPGTAKFELAAIESEDKRDDAILPKLLVKKRERQFIKELMQTKKPKVLDAVSEFFKGGGQPASIQSIKSVIGVPLSSKNDAFGAMILFHKSGAAVDQAGLRLLSGMANIMGMAIENMSLYQHSQQKKSEAAFLLDSIIKFNETLDLKATLQSVAEKGAEFGGPFSRVYLFSKMKFPLIYTFHEQQKGKTAITSRFAKQITSAEMKNVYRLLLKLSAHRSVLIQSMSHSRRIKKDVKADFRSLNIYTLIAVPLRVGGKKLGLLLLVRGKGAEHFNRQQLSFAEALASAASFAIENAQTYKSSQEMSDFLEKRITAKNSQIEQIQTQQRIRVEKHKDIIFRVKNNRYIFVNKAMEMMSGLPREKLCHKDFRADKVVAAKDRQRVRNFFQKILEKQIPLGKDLEYRHLNRKGEDHIISLTIYPETDQLGRVIGIEAIGRDITEKKRLEAELKKAKDLALLGEFSSAIAHQMRNPLGNILIGTKRLQHTLGLNDRMPETDSRPAKQIGAIEADREILDHIIKNLSDGVNNLNQVVTELLEYTKTLKPHIFSQRLETILQETVQNFGGMINQHGIEVKEFFKTDLPAVAVDAVLIGQVFQNVVHNAIQAMPEGGSLFLYSGRYRQIPNRAMIIISDSGPGIKTSEVEKVFRPFFTTKDQGTGLGLSLAHRIIDAHRGMIWICRNPCPHLSGCPDVKKKWHHWPPPRGTTVHILLPIEANLNYKDAQASEKPSGLYDPKRNTHERTHTRR